MNIRSNIISTFGSRTKRFCRAPFSAQSKFLFFVYQSSAITFRLLEALRFCAYGWHMLGCRR